MVYRFFFSHLYIGLLLLVKYIRRLPSVFYISCI